jgi:hypothetical protein
MCDLPFATSDILFLQLHHRNDFIGIGPRGGNGGRFLAFLTEIHAVIVVPTIVVIVFVIVSTKGLILGFERQFFGTEHFRQAFGFLGLGHGGNGRRRCGGQSGQNSTRIEIGEGRTVQTVTIVVVARRHDLDDLSSTLHELDLDNFLRLLWWFFGFVLHGGLSFQMIRRQDSQRINILFFRCGGRQGMIVRVVVGQFPTAHVQRFVFLDHARFSSSTTDTVGSTVGNIHVLAVAALIHNIPKQSTGADGFSFGQFPSRGRTGLLIVLNQFDGRRMTGFSKRCFSGRTSSAMIGFGHADATAASSRTAFAGGR